MLGAAREWLSRSGGQQKPSRRLSLAREQAPENPFLSARRTWNSVIVAEAASRQYWQMVALLSLLVALSAVGGIAYLGSQSKFVPYVVEVDRLGQAVAMGAVDVAATADVRVIRATVAEFISDSRLVTPDAALQMRSVERVFARIATGDPASFKILEWMNESAERDPFERAKREIVSVAIDAILQQSPETWQVDWTETTRDRQGALRSPPVAMRALVTVYTLTQDAGRSEAELLANPMGIFVKDFSWSVVRGVGQ